MGKKNTDANIYVVLDRSGSMSSIAESVISGYNEFVEQQAKLPGAKVTLVQFDSQSTDTVYDGIAAEYVKPLDRHTFVPRGMTPLYDAIGRTVARAKETVKTKAKTIFVIITDGQENASHEYTRHQIFDLIKDGREKGWEFVFIGANQDAYDTGMALGFAYASTSGWAPSASGTQIMYNTLTTSTTNYRSGKTSSVDMQEKQPS